MALIGLNLVLETMEKARLIRKKLKISQSCQKSYLNVRKRNIKFDVRDHVYL